MTDPLSITNDPLLVDNNATIELVEDALSDLWAVANKLSRLQPRKRERYSVSIFGSARIKPGQELYESVKCLAEKLSRDGCDIVTGGGPGLMQAANEGSQLGDPEDKTRSIGIRVALPFEKKGNPFLEKVYTHQTFFTRLHQFVRLSNAFIVVGGGIGTTLETLLVWQLLQVKHVDSVPLILVGEMWAELVVWSKKHMLNHDPHLADVEDLDLPHCVATVDEAFDLLKPKIDAHKRSK